LEVEGGLAFEGGDVHGAAVIHLEGLVGHLGGGQAPAVGDAEAEEGLLARWKDAAAAVMNSQVKK